MHDVPWHTAAPLSRQRHMHTVRVPKVRNIAYASRWASLLVLSALTVCVHFRTCIMHAYLGVP